MRLLWVILVSFGFVGCSSALHNKKPKSPTAKRVYQAPTPAKMQKFGATMQKIATKIPGDPSYNRMSLNTPEKKAWFKDLTYRLWDRQISKHEYMSRGLAKYPTHRYELEFIAKGISS